MKKFFGILFGAFLFVVFGDSSSLQGQNPPAPQPVPDNICEPMKEYDPGMCLSAGDGDPQGSLDSRIPVIFIHGMNPKEVAGSPDLSVWDGLGRHLYLSRWFQEQYKMYFLVYLSNVQSQTIRDMGLTFRSLIERMDQADPAFRGKPLVIVGYSMGGLIARSYMQEFRRGSGERNGERVLRLITLGTPHHGSPFANGSARDYKAGLEVFFLHQFVDGGLFSDIRWDMDNRYDLHWDNYDGMFDYGSFPENSIWMDWLNSGDTFENKIVAYGGKITQFGQIRDCVFGAEGSACFAAIMNQALGISQSDGFVPLKSALFDPCLNCVATRIYEGYDHSEIARGKPHFPWESEPLFEDIANDLQSLVAFVPSPTPTPVPAPTPPPTPGRCVETPISFGQLIRGSLTDTDCTAPLRCFLKGGHLSIGTKIKRYTFQGSVGQEVLVLMVAGAFIPGGLSAPLLRLLRPDGSLLTGNGGDPGTTNSTPTIRVRLPSSGMYTIEVTTAECDARGNYNLRVD